MSILVAAVQLPESSMPVQAYVAIYTLLITTAAGTVTTVVAAVISYLKSRDAVVASKAAVTASGASNRKLDEAQVLLDSRLEGWKEELADSVKKVESDLTARFEAAIVKAIEDERSRASELAMKMVGKVRAPGS